MTTTVQPSAASGSTLFRADGYRGGVRRAPARGRVSGVSEIDRVALLSHELLRARAAELIAEASAWSVGLSDRPHFERRNGRVRPTGDTLGSRAAAELPLTEEEVARIELGEASPGTFRDALNALTPNG